MATEQIRTITDPIERAKAAGRQQSTLQVEVDELAVVRREAIDELLDRGLKQVDIARALDITAARLNTIINGGPAPERALLAPKARAGSVVTIAVVAKRETERHRPAVMLSTHDALVKLQGFLGEFKLDSARETVDSGVLIDLNRDNLIVMMGPRVNPLVAQAITTDPAIKWIPDADGQWYLHDARTGREYHSDFDQIRPDPAAPPATCYAHIGRIRRPDGQGSYLYIGGAHAPGTAGAVEYLIRNASEIWGLARRNLWSAVVRVTADYSGTCQRADLATAVYVHGKGR